MNTPDIPLLLTELEDAYNGEGNSNRIGFGQWLQNMADDEHGTLRDSARAVLTWPSTTSLLSQRNDLLEALKAIHNWTLAPGSKPDPLEVQRIVRAAIAKSQP